ncbi:MAG: lipoyl(octanoyl) transferase LipB, partial [Alistipes sp.]
ERIEEAIIRTVAAYGIKAGRVAGASGVWIDDGVSAPRKICAIGVRASRFVTMHGFALNVSTDLGWFSYINPCGFADRGVTSIEQEIGHAVALNEVKELVVRNLSEILNVKIYKN